MKLVTRNLRGLLVALAVLALSTTAVFAGQLASSNVANSHASTTGVTHAGASGTDGTETAEPTESAEPSESVDANQPTETQNACNVDLTNTAGLSQYTHGEIVCTAAQMKGDNGYSNHGQWVRHWATSDYGTGAANRPTGH
jgi:hypothetical protein